MLRSGLCDLSDAYIVVKGIITVTESCNAKGNKSVAFKNNARFINCISKINGAQIANAEDLDVVMPMFNLLEYIATITQKQQVVCGIIWLFASKSFKCKTSITGSAYKLVAGDANFDATKVRKNETEITVPLKHLSIFWRTLSISLINCEIDQFELILTWSKNCVLVNMIPVITAPTGSAFQIADIKLYVPVITLSKENEKTI